MGAIVPTLNTGLTGLSSIASVAVPAIGTAAQLIGAVENFGNNPEAENVKREQDLALQQLQARQQQQQQQLKAETELERKRITAQAEAAEEERRSALRRAVARQRAQFGSSGIGNAGGGSSEAVLLGLFEETEGALAERERIDNLRNQALDVSTAGSQSLNVLQRTQLQERQRFERELLGDRVLF